MNTDNDDFIKPFTLATRVGNLEVITGVYRRIEHGQFWFLTQIVEVQEIPSEFGERIVKNFKIVNSIPAARANHTIAILEAGVIDVGKLLEPKGS